MRLRTAKCRKSARLSHTVSETASRSRWGLGMRSPVLIALFLIGAALVFRADGQASTSSLICSGAQENLDVLAQRADLAAVVRAIEVGPANNTLPALSAATPSSGSSLPPYRLEDLSGIGATVEVVERVYGTPPQQVSVDLIRRTQIEEEERRRESAWPGSQTSCPVTFLTPRYEQGATYLALYQSVDGEYRTTSLLRTEGKQLAASQDFTLSVSVYNSAFPDVPARIDAGLDSAVIEDSRMPVARLAAFFSVAPSPSRLPETGSAGLLNAN